MAALHGLDQRLGKTLRGYNMTAGIFGAASSGRRSGLPVNAIDFENSSSQYLSMPIASFGAYNYAKFAISVWVRPESIAASTAIFGHETTAAARNNIYFGATGKLNWDTYDGSFRNMTTTASISVGSYTHLLFHYDSANATAGNRKRIWANGSEITAFDIDDIPTAAITTPTGDVWWGNTSGADKYDGLLYQAALFSGYLPSISEVYNSGKISIAGVTGIQSMLDVRDGIVTTDYALATAWTNNNTAISSAVIP
jgi:hypothetical protein